MLSKFNIITLFPKLIEQWLETGIIAKAHENELFDISTTDLREFGIGDYRQVDDAPYGGGPGMVLMSEPIDKAILSSKSDINIFLTPSGKQLDEDLISKLHSYSSANIICGRYEGFDQRVIDLHADYQISIGQTVVSGGEVPALFLLEAMIRKIPGTLGNSESLLTESFTDGILDHPVYTRPEVYKDMEVPSVLLSGNHQKIEDWKKNNLKDI
ncbi:MAG: tRNA (guanosine(37)-N1)-methyltransferase TrmD [Candidatus Actinomarina sp.]|nr:tRNA (guanosine(37)-N1)-methyltransferase TrmD [Acidimicrobiaceae bacterium]|tara:strand:- start:181 stop:819 length:639 start_codon:yes stop_codon:yes gene_type:complete